MRSIDRKTILGIVVAGIVVLFLVLVGWVVTSQAGGDGDPGAAAGGESASATASAPPRTAAPVTPTISEGVNDYQDVPKTVPQSASVLVALAASMLAPWEAGQTVDDRREVTAEIIPTEVELGASPFAERLGDVEGAYVTADSVGGVTLTGENTDPNATVLHLDAPVDYTLHIPKGDGGETTSKGSASWRFTVDVADPDNPRITAITEPQGL